MNALQLRYQVSALSEVADDAQATLQLAMQRLEAQRRDRLPLLTLGVIAGLLIGRVLR